MSYGQIIKPASINPNLDKYLKWIDESLTVSTPAPIVTMTAETTNGVKITASSTFTAGAEPWHVSDGDKSAGTVWTSNGAPPHWIEFDFGELIQIRAVEIFRQVDITQAPNSFRIMGGKTQATMEVYKDIPNEPYGTVPLLYNIPFIPYAQFLRIENMRVAANPTAQIISLISVRVLNG